MENYKTSKKLMTKSEKALGISREQHSRQPKRRARDDETRWNSTKTMSNSKIKVANLISRSKKHSTCVRIQLIDEPFPIGCRKSEFKPKNQHQSRVTGWYPPKLCQSPKIIGVNPKYLTRNLFICVRFAPMEELTTSIPPMDVVIWNLDRNIIYEAKETGWNPTTPCRNPRKKEVMNPEFRIKVFLRVWALRIAMIDKLTISVLPTDALHHNNIKYTSTSNWYVVKVIRSLQINMLTVWQRRWTLKGSLGRMVKSPWVLFSKVDQTSAPVYDSRGFLGQTPISSSKMLFKIDFFSRWPLLLS